MTAMHSLRMLITVIGIAAITGCVGRLEYVGEALVPSAEVYHFQVQDEEYRVVSVTTGSAPIMKSLYFVGGSGCAALSSFMQTYFKDLPHGYRVYGIDKIGVSERSLGTTCSQEFWKNYTLDKLIHRNNVGLSLVKTINPAPLVGIIGVSEGGVIAATLAADAPEIRRLVMVASGGMSQRQELLSLANEKQIDELQKKLAEVEVRPESVSDRVLGLPHRYWSSVLDLDPAPTLRRVSQPTLIIIGGADESVPVDSARLAHELMPRSELVVIPGASHVFQTADGNQRKRVMALIDEFLRR